MKTVVFSLDGKKSREIDLPRAFETAYHPELIKRAVLSIESAQKQPQGATARAGRDNTARYRGARALPAHERTINVGRARLPRSSEKRTRSQGRVMGIARVRGGPKAHPIKPEKILLERINRKEKHAALLSAIATSANRALVEKRHVLEKIETLPVVVTDDFEKLTKTSDVLGVMEKLGLSADVINAKAKRRGRTGKSKRRGRAHKEKKSILIVTSVRAPLYKAARNLSGVDVCPVRDLNAKLFAPGAVAGRLSVWTEGALKQLGAS